MTHSAETHGFGITLLLAALLVSSSAALAGMEEGWAAFKRHDYASALQEFEPLAEQGNAEAQTVLGLLYLVGRGVDKDCQKAYDLLHAAASQGNTHAMDHLAGLYFSGCSPISRSYETGLQWARRAADAGDSGGMASIGQAYENGWGVERDLTAAISWYQKSADKGHPKGQLYLGDMYKHGMGVPKNSAYAMKWYRKAAEQDDPMAQFSLALGYFRGDGVRKDGNNAFKWGLRAAKNGLPIAQTFVGTLYARGTGVAKDLDESTNWYRKAAELGDPMAQNTLGALYFDGSESLPKDRAESYVWISLSAEQGYKRGIQLLQFVKKHLSQAELEEGERRLAERRKRLKADH